MDEKSNQNEELEKSESTISEENVADIEFTPPAEANPVAYAAPPATPQVAQPVIQQTYAPAQQGYAPAQQGYAPAQQGYAPAQQSYAPAQQGYAPAQQTYAPTQQGYAPAQQTYAPAAGYPGYWQPPVKKKKKSIFKRWWFWLIIVIAIVGIAVAGFAIFGGGGSSSSSSSYTSYISPYVTMVKTAKHSSYGITYGTAFEDFFTNTSWDHFTSTDGDEVVEFEGDCYYGGSPATIKVQFVVDLYDGSFTVYHMSINGVAQNKLTMAALIKKIFESY